MKILIIGNYFPYKPIAEILAESAIKEAEKQTPKLNTMQKEFSILSQFGYTVLSDLNYCTENGIEFYIGISEDRKNTAVIALIQDENLYLIEKKYLREMAETARFYAIKNVTLFTNYGIELHSTLESPKTVGFDKIEKILITE